MYVFAFKIVLCTNTVNFKKILFSNFITLQRCLSAHISGQTEANVDYDHMQHFVQGKVESGRRSKHNTAVYALHLRNNNNYAFLQICATSSLSM